MSADDGFIELRLNRQDELAGENFWPSFTDIMTVVVMIFLMVMVVLVMYNQELVRDLQSSIEKERIARETARVTGEEKESLALRLHAAESELAELDARLKRSEELRNQQVTALDRQSKTLDQQSKQLDEQASRLTSLTTERDDLKRRADRLGGELQTATTQLGAARPQADQLTQSLTAAQERQDALSSEVATLRATVGEQRRELDESREQLRRSESTLATIETDYSDLKVKYDKLVRPARSPTGRYAVEVRYGKVGGGYQIRFRGRFGRLRRAQPREAGRASRETEGQPPGRPVRARGDPRRQRPVVQRGLGLHEPPAPQLRLLLPGLGGRVRRAALNRRAPCPHPPPA